MDMLTMTATDAHSSSKAAQRNAYELLSGNCAAMRVAYLPRMEEAENEQIRDEIRILIPGDQGAFHATYRTADGRLQRTFVRDPYLSVIPPKQPHAVYCDRPSDMIVIGLDKTFFENRVREAFASDTPPIVERYAAVDPFMREIGNTLRNKCRMQKIPSGAYWDSLAGVIAVHVATNYVDKRNQPLAHAGLPPHKLERVQAFIQEHLAEVIQVRQLAALVNLSPYHFARMFKKATGKAPHAYITEKRIEHAKMLLSDSTLPLVDVAASAGFQTQSHFTDVFRKHTGVTPRIFRLNAQAARSSVD